VTGCEDGDRKETSDRSRGGRGGQKPVKEHRGASQMSFNDAQHLISTDRYETHETGTAGGVFCADAYQWRSFPAASVASTTLQ
jgi:hypothetical protein